MLDQVKDHRDTITSLEDDIRRAEAAIAEANAALLEKTRQAVAEVIAESGLSRELVLAMPSTIKEVKIPATYPVYALKSDPTKTYSRGRMPDWMVAEMVEVSLNPDSKQDRLAFRADYMVPV